MWDGDSYDPTPDPKSLAFLDAITIAPNDQKLAVALTFMGIPKFTAACFNCNADISKYQLADVNLSEFEKSELVKLASYEKNRPDDVRVYNTAKELALTSFKRKIFTHVSEPTDETLIEITHIGARCYKKALKKEAKRVLKQYVGVTRKVELYFPRIYEAMYLADVVQTQIEQFVSDREHEAKEVLEMYRACTS